MPAKGWMRAPRAGGRLTIHSDYCILNSQLSTLLNK